MKRACAGFTLIEVMIALVIVALGLGAATRAATQVASAAGQAKLRIAATWVAEDRLAARLAAREWPAPGIAEGTAAQASMEFVWRETVEAGPEPALRRIDIVVSPAAEPGYVVARISSFLSAPPPP